MLTFRLKARAAELRALEEMLVSLPCEACGKRPVIFFTFKSPRFHCAQGAVGDIALWTGAGDWEQREYHWAHPLAALEPCHGLSCCGDTDLSPCFSLGMHILLREDSFGCCSVDLPTKEGISGKQCWSIPRHNSADCVAVT